MDKINAYLYDGLLSLDLEDLALSDGAVSQSNVYDLCVLWEFNIVEDNQRSNDILNCSVINSWGNVVVSGDCFEVGFVECSNAHISFCF